MEKKKKRRREMFKWFSLYYYNISFLIVFDVLASYLAFGLNKQFCEISNVNWVQLSKSTTFLCCDFLFLSDFCVQPNKCTSIEKNYSPFFLLIIASTIIAICFWQIMRSFLPQTQLPTNPCISNLVFFFSVSSTLLCLNIFACVFLNETRTFICRKKNFRIN